MNRCDIDSKQVAHRFPRLFQASMNLRFQHFYPSMYTAPSLRMSLMISQWIAIYWFRRIRGRRGRGRYGLCRDLLVNQDVIAEQVDTLVRTHGKLADQPGAASVSRIECRKSWLVEAWLPPARLLPAQAYVVDEAAASTPGNSK